MRSKIFKAFLAVISALVISEAMLLATHLIVADRYQRIAERLVSEYRLAETTSDLVNSFYDLIQYSNDAQRQAAFKGNLGNTKALLADLDKLLANGDSWSLYVGTRNSINNIVAGVSKGAEDIAVGNFSQVTNAYLKAANDNVFVKENAGNLLLKELEGVKGDEAALARIKFWSEIGALALFAMVAIGSVLYAFFTAKKLAEPLGQLAAAAKKISSGDSSGAIDQGMKAGGGDLASLASSVDSLAQDLKEAKSKPKAILGDQPPI